MTPEALLEQLLASRGYGDPVSRDRFLNPKYESMSDPFLMHDMRRAADRIFSAMAGNERICIYSDYDADGIPGGVILHDFFTKAGYGNFRNYIPHRHTEGYGVHKEALRQLAEDGVKLVITVDVGITAVSEIEYGNSIGLETVVTDHHEPLDVLPAAFAIVNPKLGAYPDRMLCGAGTAFKLVQAMILLVRSDTSQPPLKEGEPDADPLLAGEGGSRREPGEVVRVLAEATPGWEKWLLDMAGLATLSDMVPLVDENRIIAYFGMKVLAKAGRPGLAALFRGSGINPAYLTEDDIVFSITPRLNAASRMAHPEDAFRALAARDARDAAAAAEHLSSLNDERKKIVARIMKDVHRKVSARRSSGDLGSILVIGDPSWPAGILGLIAGKVVDEYRVTTFVWGSEGDVIKGSCRGVGDISIVTLMQSVSHLLVQFGGHEDAGGFTATRETVHFLEEEFCRKYDETKHQVSRRIDTVPHDMDLELSDVTISHYRALRQMAPFGMGNPKPVFAFRNVRVMSVGQFGKTKEHLEIGLGSVRAISWYATPSSFTHTAVEGETVTLLAQFDHSVFRGKHELRLMIVDIVAPG